MCNSHSLRVIYVLCSCIDVFNLVGLVLSLSTLHVVWSSGYKTSNFSRSLHEVEGSTFMYSRVDFVLLCERGFRRNSTPWCNILGVLDDIGTEHNTPTLRCLISCGVQMQLLSLCDCTDDDVIAPHT